MQMAVAVLVLAVCIVTLTGLIARGLWDSSETKATAQAEARSYDPQPTRRRVPRSATFIVQDRHVLDRTGSTEPEPQGPDPNDTVVTVLSSLTARAETR